MKGIWKNNRGSTLLLVIIAICFIGILGSLILTLTVTNVQMKQVDYQSKENFYGTESGMDELKAGLEQISSNSMYSAYQYMLLHYSEITSNPSQTLKSVFDTKYMEALVPALCNVSYSSGTTEYNFDPELLRPYFKTGSVLKNSHATSNKLKITMNNSRDGISMATLKNISVEYTDAKQFQTTITTDINLECPNLNFDSTSNYPEFTNYSMIADHQLDIPGGMGMSINGNLYVGDGGIQLTATNSSTSPNPLNPSSYTMKINGSNLITRGDIDVEQSSKLFIGNETPMNIWAENIGTSANVTNDTTFLNINGNCKISDDLTLGAKNSDVSVKGSYYGFNYNKDNAATSAFGNQVKSQYSSAILINGANSSLDMSTANIRIAGRAFISRDSEKNSGIESGKDAIMTGESVAIKSNQIAYLVPSDYIWCQHNPVTQTEYENAAANSTVEVDFSKAPTELRNLLTTKGYAEYYYSISGVIFKYYYLEFKNQQCANTYFQSYYNQSVGTLENQAKKYAVRNGISLSSNLFLAGDALTINNSTGTSSFKSATLNDPDNPDNTLLKDAIRTAMEYKSRQLGLTVSNSEATASDFRLTDKTYKPLFQSIMAQANGGGSVIAKDAATGGNGFVQYTPGSNDVLIKRIPINISGGAEPDYNVFIINNSAAGGSFMIGSNISLNGVSYPCNKGIIVATGNINLTSSFEGLVISGGTITMGSNNTTITSNPTMVQDIFSYALNKEKTPSTENGWANDATKKFTHYFADYASANSTIGQNIDQVDISNFITYENWRKNQ